MEFELLENKTRTVESVFPNNIGGRVITGGEKLMTGKNYYRSLSFVDVE